MTTSAIGQTVCDTKQSSDTPTLADRFDTDGFVVVQDVISAREVDALREAADALSGEIAAQGGAKSTVHLLELAARNSLFLELARDPRIVDLISPLLGPDIELQHSKLASQATTKGSGGFGWHQDFGFFPHTNTDLVAVMVMLDNATPENGCMNMVRGSHRAGLLNHSKDGYFAFACQESQFWEDHPEDVVSIETPAGGVSIHHCLTLHGSGPNVSGRPRRGIVFQYRAADAYQLADIVWADTGLIVSGENHGVVRCSAQTLQLPRSNTRAGSTNQYGGAWNQIGDFAREQNRGRFSV